MEAILLKIAEAWYRRTVLAKLFSFASIGVVNVAVDVGAFTAAYHVLHLPLILSNIVAWLTAVTGSYAMNSKITFGRVEYQKGQADEQIPSMLMLDITSRPTTPKQKSPALLRAGGLVPLKENVNNR